MVQKRKLPCPESYTIAWIATLPIERAAAIALLDERHDEPEGFDQHSKDDNAYDWGKVGQHNVVITSLPAGLFGTASAAITGSQLLSSLPHIKIGLLVGIGGGIPRPGRDIRLGDVVVSQPDGKCGGVVQYDFGKAKEDSTWERTGSFNMPPTVLLNALAKLQAEHELEYSQTANVLEAMITKFPRMETQYSFQGVDNDILFPSTFKHSGGDTCDLCGLSEQVVREKRESTDPVVHYGIIASGNTLVNDADTRENIFKLAEEECLCVETVAAGLANVFPCLVIRGISDYADSHKNDRWQRYASATAAAFAVELLKYVPVRQLQAAPRAVELVERANQKITELNETVKAARSGDVFHVRVAAIRDRYNAQEKRISSDWPTKEQLAKLVKASFPHFISASTLCRFMDNRKLGNPKQFLKQLLDAKDRGHKSSLDQVYSAILYQQFNDNETPRDSADTTSGILLVEEQLAVASILVSKALAPLIGKTNSTTSSVGALCLANISIVVLSDVLGNGTTNSLGEGEVGVDRLTRNDVGCNIKVEEKTGAATTLTDAEGLACGVLDAEALVVAGFRGGEASKGLEGRGSDVCWDVAHDAVYTTDGLFAFDRESAGECNGREDGGKSD
ncbi:hypothetical protein HG530_013657 [Fusarium avenaceum]|nr:hypothetical protein HG530_013657 [Fusarium avenaceum]